MSSKQHRRICFVVHRYAPFPGGTELYVQALAEETLRRGHEVWVYSESHLGDLNGVRLSSDASILQRPFDLIVVHGDSARTQKEVLRRCDQLPSPVLYLLVAHGPWGVVKEGIRRCDVVGWSTPSDLSIIKAYGAEHKARHVRHALPLDSSIGRPGFRRKFDIAPERPLFLSCGGYWPHKRMKRLARLFEHSGVDGLLVTTGYQESFFGMPKRSARVLPLVLEERQDVLDAIVEANCYVMHSAHEGFGLVLLEAMLNRTPWLANAVGGAMQLAEFGNVYRSDTELVDLLRKFSRDEAQVSGAYRYVREHHSIELAVDDLEQAALTASQAGLVCEGRQSSRFFGLQRRPS